MRANNRAFNFKKCRLTRSLLGIIGVIGLHLLGSPAYADDIPEFNLWSGTIASIIEVNPYKIVDNVDPAAIGLPEKFIIDFKTKQIRPSKESVIRKTIAIRHIEHIEDQIILQGIDSGVEGVNDGLAWSMTLSKKNGSAILSASGDGVAYVVFGKVSPLKHRQ